MVMLKGYLDTEIDLMTSDDLKAEMSKVRRSLMGQIPVNRFFAVTGICPTPTATFLVPSVQAQSPDVKALTVPENKIWDLRRVTVTGSTPDGTTNGTVWYYKGHAPINLGPGQLDRYALDFIDWAQAIPLPSYWSRHQVTLQGGEDLYFICVGMTAGAQIIITGQVEETDELTPEAYAL